MSLDFLPQLVLGLMTGGVAWLLGGVLAQFIDKRRARSRTETFEVRSRSGKLLTTIIVPKHATPEETMTAVDEIRRVGKLAQQH